jgi:hypothetical protein
MNSYKAIDVYHMRPDRTIETIQVSDKKNEKVLYVYNYQGLFFRVFDDLLDLINFFRDAFEPKVFFEDEHQLENYLKRLRF